MHNIQFALQSVHGAIALLDDRERAIYSRRLLARDPQTLDQLGIEFGVTRERIRQVETKIINQIRENGGDEIFTFAKLPTGERWVRHYSQLGDPETAEFFKPYVGSALEVLRALGLVESWDGPWITGGFKKIFRKVRGPYLEYFLNEVSRQVPTVEEFSQQMKDLGLAPEFIDEWITDIGLRISGNRVRGTVITGVEFVHDLLEMHGKPLTWSQDIAPQVEQHWNARGILGRVQEESKTFTRTDVDSYGLAEWGFPSYEGISREIEKVVEQHGPTKIGLVVEILKAKFSIAEDSIRVYARQGNLTVKDSVVQLVNPKSHETSAPKMSDMTDRQKNGIQQFADRFEYTVPVNHDRLRGSGMPVSTGVMAIIGLPSGLSTNLQLSNLSGFNVAFSWERGGQPKMSSIRLPLMQLEAKEGQTAIFRFYGVEGAIEKVEIILE
jgi:hypothetical protein